MDLDMAAGFIHYSAKQQPKVPGSYPETTDHITFEVRENPFDTLERLQESWRSQEHAIPWTVQPELDLSNIDWHAFDPPSLASKTNNVTSSILKDIVESALLNVKTRVAQADALKQEELRRQAEVESQQSQASEAKEPYLPVLMVPAADQKKLRGKGKETTKGNDNDSDFGAHFGTVVKRQETVSIQPTDQGLLILPTQGEKRRKFALKKLFTRLGEFGESSSMGGKREALKKKIDGLSGDGDAKENIAEVECVSCLDDFPAKACIKVPCHYYCQPCFIRLIEAAVANEQQWPPKCCLNNIDSKLVMKSIPNTLKLKYKARASEMDVPVTDRIYCHHSSCGYWIQPNRIHMGSHIGRCERGHETCTLCRSASHGNKECPQDADMNLTNQLAEEEGWKRCFNCNALVEHRDACQHMTCRCGTQFCYVCGLRWRTCACTMDQLEAIKHTAESRREERLVREAQGQAELREILRQIEEYETEIQLKEQILQEELERREAEERQREIESRVQIESLRRRDIETKFSHLRDSLDELHEVQQVLLLLQQEEEGVELAREAQDKKDELERKHEADRVRQAELLVTRVSARETELDTDHETRLAQQKQIEEDYYQQLATFWGKNPYATDKIEESMSPFRLKMAEGYEKWQAWKTQELDTYQSHLEEATAVKEEIRYSEKHRTADMWDTKENELQKKFIAEQKWMEELIKERERLVGELEVEEMEGDADSLFAPRGGEEGDGNGGEFEAGLTP